MLQPGGQLDFALEALDVDRGPHLGRQHLDHHLPAQPALLGEEDTTHAPAAKLLEQAIAFADCGFEAGLEVDGRFR
jgi:hypothetical protein